MAAWVAVPVLAVMLGFLVILAVSDDASSRQANSPLLGRQAPPLTGETIDGELFDLADLAGHYVLVNFFAPWCIPCVQEHPELVNFERRHSLAGDAAVVSVVFDASESSVRSFFEDNGGDWPVVTDPQGRVAIAYGVSGIPESYLIGPDGVVLTKLVGGVSATGLDQLLATAQGAR